jgi:hypothetical protein
LKSIEIAAGMTFVASSAFPGICVRSF